MAIDLNRIAVEQRFFTSKDGTRVPMFIVRRKDVTGPAPTVLNAYGGYGLIDPPAFSPDKLAWVEQGGVFAVAYVRGGGEYGRAWHIAPIDCAKYGNVKAEALTGKTEAATDCAIHGNVNPRAIFFDEC